MDSVGRAVVDNLPLLLEGYRTTVVLSAVSLLLALALGTLTATLRVSGVRPLGWLAAGYVQVFRNTPLLLQIFFYYFGLGRLGLRLGAFEAGVLALSIYTGAYVAEVVRSGVLAMERGQLEAARALALSNAQALGLVVVPQAVRTVLPPLGNLGIALVKNSALTAAIALPELTYTADLINSRTFRTFDVFTTVAILYLTITLPLAWLVSRLERRLAVVR